MKANKAPLAIAITMALGSQSSFAETNDSVTQLEKIVVTASRSESSISNVSGTVQVISQEEVAQQSQPGQKLADLLEQLVPGFGPSTQTVTDRTQSIRGRKALILIDGISQADNRQISRHLSTIRPENIERIEIVSGASAIYGGGATGGIINVITRKPEDGDIQFASEAGIKVSGDELSTYTLNQSISGRQGNFDYLVSGTYESRDGIFDADGDRVNPDPSQLSRSDTDTKDALVKLGYDFNVEQRLEATLQYFDDQMDSDYAADTSSITTGRIADTPAPVKGLELKDQPYSKRNSIDLVYSDADLLGNNFQLQTYYREREARFYPYPNVIGSSIFVNQSTSTAEVFGVKLLLDRELTDTLRISYGLDYDIDKGKQRGQLHDLQKYIASGGKVIVPTGSSYEYGPDVEAKTLGLYLQTSWDLTDQLAMNAGVRHERAEVDISDYNPLAETWLLPEAFRTVLKGDVRKYDDNLFNIGMVYRLNDSNEVFANYSQGFEVPDASRILRNAVAPTSPLAANPAINGTNVSEANLDAIKTDSYELGWRGRFDSLLANASVFYNESDKTITFNSDYNVDLLDQKRKVYGIEGSLEYFLNDNWSLGGSYAFTEGRSYYKEVDRWLDLQAADVSPEKYIAFVSYDQEGMNVRLQSTTFADYDKGKKVSGGKVVSLDIEGYTTVDLLASFDLPVGTLKAGITNLFNKDYETVYSQWARTTYSGISAHKAEGRAYTLSYRVEY
ncbi:TonB-dependent receptor [Endozoicomonas arenosclerae]|uniref:TonB-dependent receptor n=1 Tax=Endozoicomonas arenosclerae TaxID=1633495 RepID=UPI0007840A68|nr:TonB-dependent receptor [Endozoicomonas arenosclerae]